MLAVIIKFLFPVFAFYLLQKWMRKALSPSENIQKNQDNVIEICPDCGNVQEKFHQCKFNS